MCEVCFRKLMGRFMGSLSLLGRGFFSIFYVQYAEELEKTLLVRKKMGPLYEKYRAFRHSLRV